MQCDKQGPSSDNNSTILIAQKGENPNERYKSSIIADSRNYEKMTILTLGPKLD